MQLLEREGVLVALDSALSHVGSGAGMLVLVAGEAGVGKTTAVDAWCRGLGDRARVKRGVCDGSATPHPLGPFVDAFPDLLEASGVLDRAGVIARVREGLLPDDAAPVVLVIEDLHWSDEATLDVLRSLAMRVADLGALLLVTYRLDEIEPGQPLAVLLGDLAGRPSVRMLEIPALSFDAVATLAHSSGADVEIADLHRRTGGNAFYVTEVLASGGDSVPTSVRDAVRARIARLDADSRGALDVVALAGLRAEPSLLEDVLGEVAASVDIAVQRGVLLATPDGLTFRHDLARRVVADDAPPMRRLGVHRAILRCLLARPELAVPARVAYHAEAAGDLAIASSAAENAARQSAVLGAHREAVLQYQRALRTAPPNAIRRVSLLEGLSYELYVTGRIDEAITIRAQVLLLRRSDGNRLAVISTHRWMSRLHWFVGHGQASRAHGQRAVELLQPDDVSAEAAMAWSNAAHLRMVQSDAEGTRTFGWRAIDVARAAGAEDVVVHALISIASISRVYPEVGERPAAGEVTPALEEILTRALEAGMHEHAARAYCNLVSTSLGLRRLGEAERWVQPGIEFCDDRDLDTWGIYLQGLLAVLRVSQGRFVEARQAADRLLGRQEVPAINRFNALLALGLVQARAGDPGAEVSLSQAAAIAEDSGELQRQVPAVSALAELAWLERSGWPVGLDRVYALAEHTGSEWDRGELAFWMQRAGRLTGPAPDVALPYSLQLAGRWDEATTAWEALGCRYERAVALAHSDSVHQAEAGVRLLIDCGATATAARLRPRLTALGGRVGRPRQPATRRHPGGLTPRQAEVLGLLAQGAGNNEIATALVISARTAEHHVSAVLEKLGVATRGDAVLTAIARGWLDVGTQPDPI